MADKLSEEEQAELDSLSPTKESPAEKPAEDLELAAVVEPIVEPELEPPVEVIEEPIEVIPDEPSPEEKSRLGRRTKKVEDRTGRLEDMFEQFLTNQQRPVQEEEEDFDPDMPLTAGDMDAYLDKRDAKLKTADTEWYDNYVNQLVILSRDLPEEMTQTEVEAILAEHDANFTTRAHKDPAIAAQINFLKAHTSYLSKKVVTPVEPENPFNGKTVEVPSGSSGGAQMKTKETETVEIDAETQQLIKDFGLSEKEAQEALTEKSTTLKRMTEE